MIEKEISPRRIGLLDAVRITLLKNPTIKLSSEDVAQAAATLRIATGQFDFQFSGNVNWSRQQNELSPHQIDQVKSDFHKLQTQRDALTKTIATTQQDIATLKAGRDPLPDTSNITDPVQRADADQQNLINQQINDLTNQLIDSIATPAQLAQLNQIRQQSRDLGAKVETDLLNGLQKQKQQVVKQIEQFPPNSVRRTETTSYEMQLIKEFRNGISFGPYVDYTRTNDNFTRRSGNGDLAQSNIGLQVTVPLGRGVGEAASAGERSSAVDLEASRLALQHTASQTVLGTILAYWNVVAAQERLQLLLRSELISGTTVELSRELIKADELAASELSQILARRSIATAQRIAAEQDLVAATQSLAVAMGLDLKDIAVAPIAAEGFPEPLPESRLRDMPTATYAANALQNRADRLASLKLQQSGKILVDAARVGLRPIIALQLRAGYSAIYQGSRYESYWRQYSREEGPNFSAALSWQWPIENNAAKGALQQTTSLYNQNVIQTDQLSRNIISGVVVDLSALQRNRAQIESARQSSEGFEKAVETQRQQLNLGNSTLIDAIETEQNLTNALLQLVGARQQYAASLAQLRFDTGTLLPREKQGSLTRSDLVTLPPTYATVTPVRGTQVRRAAAANR